MMVCCHELIDKLHFWEVRRGGHAILNGSQAVMRMNAREAIE